MPDPLAAESPLPEVRFSGRFVRASDRRRNIILTLGMVTVWLAGFTVWIGLWRYGRWLGGFEGQIIRFCAFCAGGFHVVSMGFIRTAIDQVLKRFGR